MGSSMFKHSAMKILLLDHCLMPPSPGDSWLPAFIQNKKKQNSICVEGLKRPSSVTLSMMQKCLLYYQGKVSSGYSYILLITKNLVFSRRNHFTFTLCRNNFMEYSHKHRAVDTTLSIVIIKKLRLIEASLLPLKSQSYYASVGCEIDTQPVQVSKPVYLTTG